MNIACDQGLLPMWLCPFFQWMQDSALTDVLSNSRILLPLLEILHLLGLTVGLGTIVMVDFGLLGIGMRRQPAVRIAQQLAPYTWGGIALLMVTGPPLMVAEARKMYMNDMFPIKMLILAATLIFHFTVYRRAMSAPTDPAAWRAKLIGGLSLTLWLGTGFAAKLMEIF
jgi:hypothetical protein